MQSQIKSYIRVYNTKQQLSWKVKLRLNLASGKANSKLHAFYLRIILFIKWYRSDFAPGHHTQSTQLSFGNHAEYTFLPIRREPQQQFVFSVNNLSFSPGPAITTVLLLLLITSVAWDGDDHEAAMAPSNASLSPKKDATMAWAQKAAQDGAGKKQKKPLKQELSEQMDLVTIGGLSHAWAAKGPVVALFWAAWSLFCLALLILNSISILTEYFSYPVNINLVSQMSPYQMAPAVTVCPLARVSCRRLALAALQDVSSTSTLRSLFNASQCCVAVSQMADFEGNLATLGCESNGSAFRTQLTFDELLQSSEDEELDIIFPDKEDIFVECQLNDKNCVKEIKSSPLTDLSSKNCFTIFGDLDNEMEDEFIISYAGAEGGITLIMKTEVGDYPGSGLAESTGFLVQVHYRYENPNAFHSGFLVSPGTETRVVLTVHKTERQPKPYSSQCVSSWNETGFEPLLFYSTENFKPSYENYSKEECSHMCSHRKVMQLCRCYQSSERINFNVTKGSLPGPAFVTTKDLDVCMTKEEGNCASKVDYELLPDKEKDCNCRPECSLFGFDSRVSTAPFPTPNYRVRCRWPYDFSLPC
ncbi:acid-sensing ion channel 2 [Penaeus vannamei]|uniref:acid-sensing ion channel 2 n=1 Tax=Penaeus vannamei TaxID=6689 RepID=UPI00387F7409